MKQKLPDYIRQNKKLRQALLAQKGGIMKYLAEHLDADGIVELFNGYQDQSAEAFFEVNKWDLWINRSGEETRLRAIGHEHFKEELRYQRDLVAYLDRTLKSEIQIVNDVIERYLTEAYTRRFYPSDMSNRDFYHNVIESYRWPDGLAYECMNIILKEHHAQDKIEKTEEDLYLEFKIRQLSHRLNSNSFSQMRRAVADMLDGKPKERRLLMAIDTMKKVRSFSQMIYTDREVQILRECELPGYSEIADRRESDGRWLRDVAEHAVLKSLNNHDTIHSMRYYFADFVMILREVGRIWAAQLLVCGFEMKDLEEKVGCIMNPVDSKRKYYKDKYYIDDLPDEYCVSDYDLVKEMLLKTGEIPLMNIKDKEVKAAIEKLLKAKDVKNEFVFKNKKQWWAVYKVLEKCQYPTKMTVFVIKMKELLESKEEADKLESLSKVEGKSPDYRLYVVKIDGSRDLSYESLRAVAKDVPLLANCDPSMWKEYAEVNDNYKQQYVVAEFLMKELGLMSS